MNVLVAGATDAIGRLVIMALVRASHQAIGITTTVAGLRSSLARSYTRAEMRASAANYRGRIAAWAFSFVHVEDTASATVADWLPQFVRWPGARPVTMEANR